MRTDDLMHYLHTPGAHLPVIDFHRAYLPQIDGKEARISGVCTIDDSQLLFSASVEDTPDWIKDGSILGSFVGIYSLKENKSNRKPSVKKQTGRSFNRKTGINRYNQPPGRNNYLYCCGR